MSSQFRILLVVGVALGLALALRNPSVPAQQPETTPPAAEQADTTPTPPGLTRLSPKYPVWIDKANKRVVMTGEIVQVDGPMEMFACLKRTKEHESILAVPTEAFVVHAGLLAVGAQPGAPVQFRPEYVAASGTEIEITLYWTDKDGKRQHARAQDWLHNVKTGKPLDHAWVFAGSGFWTDARTGKRHYQAEEGDFICVSNFTTAMLDLPIESSQANDALLFEGAEGKIPPKGTQVMIVLTPKLKDLKDDRGGDPDEAKDAAK